MQGGLQGEHADDVRVTAAISESAYPSQHGLLFKSPQVRRACRADCRVSMPATAAVAVVATDLASAARSAAVVI